MIFSTTYEIPGRKTKAVLGIASGSTVRARHAGRSLVAWMRGVVGGEIVEYTKMIAEAREQALDRMAEQAAKMGANAVVGVRFGTAEVMSGAAEIVAYGTAAVLEAAPEPADTG